MPSIAEALRAFDLPRMELRLLLAYVDATLTHTRIIADPERELEPVLYARFSELVGRRVQGEPLAYLLGLREFYGRQFHVTPGVLIPRPETEHLIDAALERMTAGAADVLDLGSGSGAIAVTLALERPAWQVSAVDVSLDALRVARRNAGGLGASVMFFHGSWYAPLPVTQLFDLIVSNPPYIAQSDPHLLQGDLRFEPRQALTDNADGLSCLREIVAGARAHLHGAGWLMVEHGYDQGHAVRQLLRAQGMTEVETLADLAGHDRVTLARNPESL